VKATRAKIHFFDDSNQFLLDLFAKTPSNLPSYIYLPTQQKPTLLVLGLLLVILYPSANDRRYSNTSKEKVSPQHARDIEEIWTRSLSSFNEL
jgi:hypothetical protein